MPVFLTLDWGEEEKDPGEPPAPDGDDDGDDDEADEAEPEPSYEYVEPHGVRAEKRRRWELGRDCALRLHEAGVPFAFGSGTGKSADLWKRVRKLVEVGLPADVAMRALTRGAAELLGAGDRLGRIEPGFDATFAIWTDDPMDEDAQLAWLFVDGVAHEFEIKEKKQSKGGGGDAPADGLDVTGTWVVTYRPPQSDSDSESTFELEMDDEGGVTGNMSTINPMTEEAMETSVAGVLEGSRLSLSGNVSFGDFDLDISLEVEVDGDAMDGEITFSGGFGERTVKATGEREPLNEREAQR